MEVISILIFLSSYVFSEKIGEENDLFIDCRDKIRRIGLDKDDQFEFVTAKLNSKLVLWCHYCKEGVTFAPKIWYRQSRLTDEPPKEVELGMDSKLSDNRVYNTPDHSLVFNKVIEDDAALYYCQGPRQYQEEYKFNYMIDVVPANISLKQGSVEDWKKYTQSALKDVNDKFAHSQDSEYSEIRMLGVKIHTVFEWTRWGPCNGCFKIRKRFSECRMETQLLNETKQEMNTTHANMTKQEMNTTHANIELNPKKNKTSPMNEANKNNKTQAVIKKEEKLLNSFELSCHSLLFAKYYPTISSQLMQVKNYMFTESCYAPCQISGIKTSPKYRNSLALHEGESFKLICPEATREQEVVWMKNGVTVTAHSTKEGNVIVDSYHNLHIKEATRNEDGSYTCFINGQKIQEVMVTVMVRSVLSSKAFLRHIQYLGFIFIFSVIFYIAGLIITCARRDTFKKIDFKTLKVEYTRWDREESEVMF